MPLPSKWIKCEGDVEAFKQSEAFNKIRLYVNACVNAVKSKRRSWALPRYREWMASSNQDSESRKETTVPVYAQWMVPLSALFVELRAAVEAIPLHDMKQQRFGNKAFRDFHHWLDENMKRLLTPIAAALPSAESSSQERISAIVDDLTGYLKDSFGNQVRIDYGTGHELHFFLFLVVCLDECGATTLPESDQETLLATTTLCCFWEYIYFMRLLQRHYKLEPAGSHGVWGLDDYHHLSFIFGASQLVMAEKSGGDSPAVLPKHITEATLVEQQRDEYLYFENIAWIRENKRGPFHEHSSMLYNISGIDEWSRITAGMIRMYEAEVLSKYNVVQHLLFGTHLPPPTRIESKGGE